MAIRTGMTTHVGVCLAPDRSHAVTWGSACLEADVIGTLRSVSAGPGDLESLIERSIGRGRTEPESVTVDISQLLLEAVLSVDPRVPRIAVIRIVPRPADEPALARSPAESIERLIEQRRTVTGGHDLRGSELCPLDRAGLDRVVAALARQGTRDVAIVGAGSQACSDHERAVAEAVQDALPGARISVASDFGGQGLVAREATVALDCALGPLTDELLTRGERALARWAPRVPLRIARGDGGYSTPSRVRALPVVTLGAVDALELSGAARLVGRSDCRVLLPRPDGQVAGDVRRGLVAVRPGELRRFGVELVVPTAVLTPDLGAGEADEMRRITDVPVVTAHSDPAALACIGAAVSRPTSWLDEFAFIESAGELDRVRRDAQERANAIVMANGAAPGSAVVAEFAAVAVPYSPPGTIRIRVRVAGAPDTDPRRIAVSDRMAP